MALRCKPGDVALIIKGVDSGKMVTCLKFVAERLDCTNINLWEVDRMLDWTWTNIPFCPDDYLMPIRPDKIKEEHLNEPLSYIA